MADARPSRPQINTPKQAPRNTRRPVRWRPGMPDPTAEHTRHTTPDPTPTFNPNDLTHAPSAEIPSPLDVEETQ